MYRARLILKPLPSPYHREAGGSLKVVDAGRQAYAGRMRSAPFDAVAALWCCTRAQGVSRVGLTAQEAVSVKRRYQHTA